jgi:transposase InsO family protein
MCGHSSGVVNPSHRCHHGGRSGHRPLWSARAPAQPQWPEFIASCMHDWLKVQKIKTLYIKPGSPWENGHVESFHEKLRDECLNRELFCNLHEARIILESWRVECNVRRSAQRAWLPNPERVCREPDEPVGWALRAPKPRGAHRGRRSGEPTNATRWQTNEKQNTNEPAELQL